MNALKSGWRLSAFLVAFISFAAVGEAKDVIQSRSYLGAFATLANIGTGGDLNGTLAVQASSFYEVDLVPSINQSFGFGFLAGHREGAYAGEVSYWRSFHTATWQGSTGPAVYHSINVDFKRYFLTQLPVQPFLNLGVSFPWVVYPGASFTVSGGNILASDLSLSGIGVNLGAGVEIYPVRCFSITGAVIQRWAGFDQMNGYFRQGLQIRNSNGVPVGLEGDGLNFYLGATVGIE